MADQTAKLDWRNGVPIATAFDDPYFSLDDGLAETQHVFLAGNDLPARFAPDFHVAELGFGTGLNFLVTWQAWLKAGSPGRLRFTSFEAYPMASADMQAALAYFPALAQLAQPLVDRWAKGERSINFADGPQLRVVVGDARTTVPVWDSNADAWFLDGFSPAKNPQLWGADLLRAVGQHTNAGGTAATYSAAGHVRQSLTDAGFAVERTKGYGRKRHMTRAWMTDAK